MALDKSTPTENPQKTKKRRALGDSGRIHNALKEAFRGHAGFSGFAGHAGLTGIGKYREPGF